MDDGRDWVVMKGVFYWSDGRNQWYLESDASRYTEADARRKAEQLARMPGPPARVERIRH